MRSLLLVDDSAPLRRSLERALRRKFDVTCAESGRQALEKIEDGERFDVVILDVEMPEMDGRQFYERLASVAPQLRSRVIVFTGGPSDPDLEAWVRSFPEDRVVRKDVPMASLIAVIELVAEMAPDAEAAFVCTSCLGASTFPASDAALRAQLESATHRCVDGATTVLVAPDVTAALRVRRAAAK